MVRVTTRKGDAGLHLQGSGEFEAESLMGSRPVYLVMCSCASFVKYTFWLMSKLEYMVGNYGIVAVSGSVNQPATVSSQLFFAQDDAQSTVIFTFHEGCHRPSDDAQLLRVMQAHLDRRPHDSVRGFVISFDAKSEQYHDREVVLRKNQG